MKTYTVLLFDHNDMIIVRFRDILAWSRKEALFEAMKKKDLPEWSTWDAIEKPNIQPSLFPHEDADNCQNWTRMIV